MRSRICGTASVSRASRGHVVNRFVEPESIEWAAPYRVRPEYRDAGREPATVRPLPLTRARSLFGFTARKPILFLGGRVSITFGDKPHFFVGDDAA
jgi:hypothetical protein